MSQIFEVGTIKEVTHQINGHLRNLRYCIITKSDTNPNTREETPNRDYKELDHILTEARSGPFIVIALNITISELPPHMSNQPNLVQISVIEQDPVHLPPKEVTMKYNEEIIDGKLKRQEGDIYCNRPWELAANAIRMFNL